MSDAQSSVDVLGGIPARTRILAAALKLFVEKGYFNTNVPDLSRESRCSVGSIYHNFKNKQEVAEALYYESVGSFRQELYRALTQRPYGTEKLSNAERLVKNLVRFVLEFAEVNHQVSKYLWLCRHQEFIDRAVRQPTRVGYDPLGKLLTKTIKSAIRRNEIVPLRATTLWSILFGIPLGYLRDWLDGYHSEPPSAVAEELGNACWRALSTGLAQPAALAGATVNAEGAQGTGGAQSSGASRPISSSAARTTSKLNPDVVREPSPARSSARPTTTPALSTSSEKTRDHSRTTDPKAR